jgi:maltose/moltooligosaccharide transporter
MRSINLPKLSFWQIWNMNIGFLGIQFSFGLQQTAINPIFSFLGAHQHSLPILNLAGPVTGLVIQPLIGAISDKTWSPRWGRRKPFFLIGALAASLCLFLFPYSPSLWFAVGLLWILDAANNTAMEPYRAFIGDKLPDSQLSTGFQMQSLFVGAGITLANFSLFLFQDWFGDAGSAAAGSNPIPRWVYYSFFLGAIASVTSIVWSVVKTPENPPPDEVLEQIRYAKENHTLLERAAEPFKEIIFAIRTMPTMLKQLALVYLFQWYALFIYWQFIAPMLRTTLYGVSSADYHKYEGLMEAQKAGQKLLAADQAFFDNVKQALEQALAQTGLMNGTYNFVTMLVALILVPIAVKFGNKTVYVASLFLTGIAMLLLPFIQNEYALLLPMALFGIGWATMMGIPYSMVTEAVPEERRGVYMGIVNMMIVIPMLIQTLTFGLIEKHLLNDSAVNAILMAGVLFILGGFSATLITQEKAVPKQTDSEETLDEED